jgi:hypothetical protein
MTMLKKKQAATAFHIHWDLLSHIMKFACKLDKQQKLCRDIGVLAADATKIQHYVESMYASEMFDDKEMQAWEIKPSANKTWDAAKTHFVTIYKSKEKFNAEREARSGGFKSASSFFDTGSRTGSRASNNPPHVPSNINSAFSPADHHSLLEYTNSLEGALETATEHAAAITLDIDTLGYFRKPQVAWAGPSAAPQSLFDLQHALWNRLLHLKVPLKPSAGFRPHITLARDARAPVVSDAPTVVWPVRRMALMASLSNPAGVSGVSYVPITERQLA